MLKGSSATVLAASRHINNIERRNLRTFFFAEERPTEAGEKGVDCPKKNACQRGIGSSEKEHRPSSAYPRFDNRDVRRDGNEEIVYWQ